MSGGNLALQRKTLRALEIRAADFGASITPITETAPPFATTHYVLTMVVGDAERLLKLFDMLAEVDE